MKIRYEEPRPATAQDWNDAVVSGDSGRICSATVGLAFHHPDWKEAEEKCLSLLENQDGQVRAIAITCLGHIARIHGRISFHQVVSLLQKLRDDKTLGGIAEDALDDILIFVKTEAALKLPT